MRSLRTGNRVAILLRVYKYGANSKKVSIIWLHTNATLTIGSLTSVDTIIYVFTYCVRMCAWVFGIRMCILWTCNVSRTTHVELFQTNCLRLCCCRHCRQSCDEHGKKKRSSMDQTRQDWVTIVRGCSYYISQYPYRSNAYRWLILANNAQTLARKTVNTRDYYCRQHEAAAAGYVTICVVVRTFSIVIAFGCCLNENMAKSHSCHRECMQCSNRNEDILHYCRHTTLWRAYEYVVVTIASVRLLES